MAEIGGPRLEETVRRAFEVNLRYYEALGQLTADYLKSVADLWKGLGLPLTFDPFGSAAPRPAPPPSSPPPAAVPALVLEAEAGGQARGLFLVSNQLARRVSAPVGISPFTDAAGRVVQPAVKIEPEVVTLDPGGQSLVQIVVAVSEELEPGVSYRAEISVPGLSDGRVPVTLRRRLAETGG